MKKFALASTILIVSLAILASSCAKKPEAELQRAESALAAAKDAGAQDLAPSDYQAAENKLNEGKKLVDKECYKKAKPVLDEAANLADIAKQKALSAKQPGDVPSTGAACQPGTCPSGKCTCGACPSGTCATGTCPCGVSTAPDKPTKPTGPVADTGLYIVKKGDCLWNIAKKKDIYSDPYLWPLIYNANKDQIKNPNLIYPKQSLNIPREPSQEDMDKAWKKTGKPGVKKAPVAEKPKKVKKANKPKKEEAAPEAPKEEPAK